MTVEEKNLNLWNHSSVAFFEGDFFYLYSLYHRPFQGDLDAGLRNVVSSKAIIKLYNRIPHPYLCSAHDSSLSASETSEKCFSHIQCNMMTMYLSDFLDTV